jgi:hypothetical protein
MKKLVLLISLLLTCFTIQAQERIFSPLGEWKLALLEIKSPQDSLTLLAGEIPAMSNSSSIIFKSDGTCIINHQGKETIATWTGSKNGKKYKFTTPRSMVKYKFSYGVDFTHFLLFNTESLSPWQGLAAFVRTK